MHSQVFLILHNAKIWPDSIWAGARKHNPDACQLSDVPCPGRQALMLQVMVCRTAGMAENQWTFLQLPVLLASDRHLRWKQRGSWPGPPKPPTKACRLSAQIWQSRVSCLRSRKARSPTCQSHDFPGQAGRSSNSRNCSATPSSRHCVQGLAFHPVGIRLRTTTVGSDRSCDVKPSITALALPKRSNSALCSGSLRT